MVRITHLKWYFDENHIFPIEPILKHKQVPVRQEKCFLLFSNISFRSRYGGRVGLVVRALAFHQCGPGSISAPGVIRGLSLLVLYSALRDFPPGTPVFPSHQKPTFDLICRKTVVN